MAEDTRSAPATDYNSADDAIRSDGPPDENRTREERQDGQDGRRDCRLFAPAPAL